jgi:mono/diheme cytochrome c family protein
MRPWIRRTLAGAAAVAALGAALVFAGDRLAERKLHRRLPLPPERPLALNTDAATLERGRYLFTSRACAECHGADGAGRAFIDGGPNGLYVKAPKIGPGAGSVVAAYRPQDWERTIRHGIKPSGEPVFIMPSEDYNRLTDVDVAALVSYVRSLPTAAGSGLEARVPLPVRVLYGFGRIPDAAEKIDHALPPAEPVAEGATAEHGRYVAGMCIGCHGAGLAGGKIPGGPPDWPAAANLTPGEGSAMPRYASFEAFRAMLDSGRRPDGSRIAVMPFESLRALNATDSEALYAYLATLAPKTAGSR